MKATLILLGLIAAVAYAEEGKAVFKKCADFKLQYAELKSKVHLDDVLGPWSMIRVGPCKEDNEKFDKHDCVREVFYREDTTAENTISVLKHVRKDNEHKVCSGVFKYTGLADKEVDNYFESTFKDPEDNKKEIHSESVLIDTDHGETWGLWASCIEFEPANTTVVWGISSRYPWIDARVEQKLVERIEKYGGVGPTQLRGVGQTDCFKHKDH